MNLISITWNTNRGTETKISYSANWMSLTNLEKADNLKDAIEMLNERYNTIVAKGLSNGGIKS